MYLKTVVFKNLLNIPLLIVIIDPYENHVLGLFGLFILFRLMLVDDELFVLYINLYDHQLGHGKRATCIMYNISQLLFVWDNVRLWIGSCPILNSHSKYSMIVHRFDPVLMHNI